MPGLEQGIMSLPSLSRLAAGACMNLADESGYKTQEMVCFWTCEPAKLRVASVTTYITVSVKTRLGLLAFATGAIAQMGSQMMSPEMEAQLKFYEKVPTVKIAHAVMAALAFGFFFPAGAISMAIVPNKWALRVHLATQIFGYILFIAGFGMGVWLARGFKMVDAYHPTIGIVVFSLVSLQPILGTIHHYLFPKYRRRTFWTYAHLWIGRAVITLGMINIGLGLKFGNKLYPKDHEKDQKGWIAMSVILPIIWVVWVAAAVRKDLQKWEADKTVKAEGKRLESASEESTNQEKAEQPV